MTEDRTLRDYEWGAIGLAWVVGMISYGLTFDAGYSLLATSLLLTVVVIGYQSQLKDCEDE